MEFLLFQLFCLIYLICSSYTFTNVFKFEPNCSFRPLESEQTPCVSCLHDMLSESRFHDCSNYNHSHSVLPKPAEISNIALISHEDNSYALNLNLKAENTHKLETLDLRIAWSKPKKELLLENSATRSYEKAVWAHKSTLKFQFSDEKPTTTFNSLRDIYITVTLREVFPFGKYEIQLVSHPSCFGSGLSESFHFNADYESIVMSKSQIKPSTETNSCPAPQLPMSKRDPKTCQCCGLTLSSWFLMFIFGILIFGLLVWLIIFSFKIGATPFKNYFETLFENQFDNQCEKQFENQMEIEFGTNKKHLMGSDWAIIREA